MFVSPSRLLLLSCAAAFPAGPAVAQEPEPAGLDYARDIRPVLENYCWDCHGDGAKKGDVALDGDADEAAILKNRKLWTGAMFHIEQWTMPPLDKKNQPAKEERERLVRWLDNLLNPVDPAHPDPGRVTIRRLNRVEYNNTVRDLLGITSQPASEFPEDDTGYGFDNIGDVLALPPILMERYLIAADRVLLEAIPEGPPPPSATLFTRREMRGQGLEHPDDRAVQSFTSNGESSVDYPAPVDGEYLLRVKAWGDRGGDELPKLEIHAGGTAVKTADISAETKEKAETVEVRVTLTKGSQALSVAFLNDYYEDDAADRNLYVQSVEVEGPVKAVPRPLNAAAQALFAESAKTGGETAEGARAVLESFTFRAFRRPPLPAEVDRLMRIFTTVREAGESWRDGLRITMKAVLVSPHFLYRIETPADPAAAAPAAPVPAAESHPVPPGPVQTADISEFALASRLSYWLWSTMPDAELLALASRNELRARLSAQVQRMLSDPRARALPENFGGQWLELRSLQAANPDRERFPEYTPELRDAMRQETEELFRHIMRENLPVTEFLSADYTFLNERLAGFYGIGGVEGHDFRMVKLDPGSNRRGVLTHASVLTVTSDSIRTSPVKRGKWLLENMLGVTAPPPPPNVPALEEGEKVEAGASVRARLEAHRSKPGCASCHALIDPMGFGLEHFNAIGKWRDQDGIHPVDAAGVLTTGQKFSGAGELASILLNERKDAFLRNLARKMLTYALGRGVEPYDRPAIDAIVSRMAAEGNTFQSLVLAIADSIPFQKRRVSAP